MKLDKSPLLENGFFVINFPRTRYLEEMQKQIESSFNFDPIEFHFQNIDDDKRLSLIKSAKDSIVKNQSVKNLLLDNLSCFESFFGPDIDYQEDIHLRVSRPNHENDFIDWHRDTFYGNFYWEMNIWFPIFSLFKGAGLALIEKSHLHFPKQIEFAEEKNSFRKRVTKGSIANELGYQYAPKTDEVISNIQAYKTTLLTPTVGQAVIFFGHMVHRSLNNSNKTRISIDVRLKNMLAQTNTKLGYYKPLTRGCITQYVEKMTSDSG